MVWISEHSFGLFFIFTLCKEYSFGYLIYVFNIELFQPISGLWLIVRETLSKNIAESLQTTLYLHHRKYRMCLKMA